jgi:hypothetical protein
VRDGGRCWSLCVGAGLALQPRGELRHTCVHAGVGARAGGDAPGRHAHDGVAAPGGAAAVTLETMTSCQTISMINDQQIFIISHGETISRSC